MDAMGPVSLDRSWLLLLTDLGVNVENVFRRAGLPLDLQARESVKLGFAQYTALYAALEAEADDPLLPIRIAESISSEAFHPAIFGALCSPDLTTALTRLAEYKRLVAPMVVTIEEDERGLFVGVSWQDPSATMTPSMAATEMTLTVRIARIGTRESVVPVRVEGPQALEPTAAYREYFGVEPTHGPRYGVTFSPADARRPFLTASEAMWDVFQPELRRRLNQLQATAKTAERVRSILLETLPSGEASIEGVAQRLGVGPRTLQRSLKTEGVTFKGVVRATREALARHYLVETTISHPEIAFLIGFDEPSSFFRAFKNWTGTTPQSLRAEAMNRH
ncbi:MAG: AraC family transcriptional regulator ligand-binding domain-containing protein [Myxococcota bacterium]